MSMPLTTYTHGYVIPRQGAWFRQYREKNGKQVWRWYSAP